MYKCRHNVHVFCMSYSYTYNKLSDRTALWIQMTSTAAQIISDAELCHANTIRITVNDEDCRTPIEGVLGQTLVSTPVAIH